MTNHDQQELQETQTKAMKHEALSLQLPADAPMLDQENRNVGETRQNVELMHARPQEPNAQKGATSQRQGLCSRFFTQAREGDTRLNH